MILTLPFKPNSMTEGIFAVNMACLVAAAVWSAIASIGCGMYSALVGILSRLSVAGIDRRGLLILSNILSMSPTDTILKGALSLSIRILWDIPDTVGRIRVNGDVATPRSSSATSGNSRVYLDSWLIWFTRRENWDLLAVLKHENNLLTGVSFVPSHTISYPISVGMIQMPPFFNTSVTI